MDDLPHCSSREDFAGGGDRFRCTHPKVQSRDSIVSRMVCRTCSYADTEHVPKEITLKPCCDFQPLAVIADEEAFDCLHPCHQSVTRQDCAPCMDHTDELRQETRPRTWAVGVTTAPRKVSTLGRMLNSLEEAGWSEAWIFAEPHTDTTCLCPDHRLIVRSETLGAFPNWYLSLTELVMRAPAVDAYLMCQDDILLSPGLRDYALAELWPASEAQVVSFYCAAANEQNGARGFVRLDAGWNTCGALALVFPNAVARALLCDSLFLHHRNRGPRRGMANIDSVIGLWCRQSGIPFYLHQPTLVQHIGDHSTLWGKLSPSPRRSASSIPPDLSSRTQTSTLGRTL